MVAKKRGSSVNAIAEAELTKFLEFGVHSEVMDYAVVRKAFLTKLLDYLSEDEVRDFGQWSATDLAPETIRFYHGKLGLDSVLNSFERLGAKYSNFYAFRHESEGSAHTIVLSHGMGGKWSLFFEANLKKIFFDLGLSLETELSKNILIGRFTLPQAVQASGGKSKKSP